MGINLIWLFFVYLIRKRTSWWLVSPFLTQNISLATHRLAFRLNHFVFLCRGRKNKVVSSPRSSRFNRQSVGHFHFIDLHFIDWINILFISISRFGFAWGLAWQWWPQSSLVYRISTVVTLKIIPILIHRVPQSDDVPFSITFLFCTISHFFYRTSPIKAIQLFT